MQLAPFSNVIGKTTWPQLKRVFFRFLAASDKDLMCFFKEHKSCLKHLCLADIDVTGSWTDILNLLQSLVDLDNCSLLKPLGDWTHTSASFERVAEGYILAKGPIEPLRGLDDLKFGVQLWTGGT